MFISLIVLICVIIKHYGLCGIYKPERPAFDGISVKKYMVIRLTLFTMINITIWIIPVFDRIYIMINDDQSIFWLHAFHHYMIALNGFLNMMVWTTSSNWKSLKESYRLLVDDEYSRRDTYVELNQL